MSFWDDLEEKAGDVANAIGAYNPMTLGAHVFSSAVNVIAPGNALSKGLDAPFQYFTHNSSPSIKGATTAFKSAGGAAASVASGPLGSAAGFNSEGLSMASGLFDSGSGAKQNTERGPVTYEKGASPTPFRAPASNDSFLVPALIIGGAGLLAVLLFTKGK